MAGGRLASGDYSGPVGARTILRNREVDAAVLETARGGILRRGLAVERADVAVVTNVSRDHFGEYGIDDVEALVVPDDLGAALDAAPGARDHWESFPASARKNLLWWVKSAKRPETRQRRIAAIASEAAEGRRANGA